MVLPIRSIAAPLLTALLVIASAPVGAWANDQQHQNTNGGQRPAPGSRPPQPHEQPRGQAPSFGGHGGGASSFGGQAAGHPAQIDGPRGGPTWHGAGPVAPNGGRGQVYGGSNNTQPNAARPSFTRPNNGTANYGQTDAYRGNYGRPNGQSNYGQRNDNHHNYDRQNYGQQNYGQQNYAQQNYGQRQDYRPNHDDGRRWNNGWRNDRRYDWAGWRGAHRDLFHGNYYYPHYAGYGYERLGIGGALDEAFMDEQYWIEDPGYYHLPPAYGPYRWIRYYNDCLLIDIDNGEVVDVLYNVFW